VAFHCEGGVGRKELFFFCLDDVTSFESLVGDS